MLTRRIAHLIATKRARPEEILALTFTEKAAAEMSERVDQLIPWGYAETAISTFHAFGDRVLREWALEIGLDPQFRVLSQPEQVIFLRERLFKLPLERFRPLGDPTRHLAALTTLVSRAKDEDVSPRQYRDVGRGAARSRRRRDEEQDEAQSHVELAAFYEAHQRLLAEAGLVDFGDQIHRTLALLREHAAALAAAAGALPLRAGRRVPGHEPRAARDARAARRRDGQPDRGRATTTRRSTAGAARPRPTCWRSAAATPARARWC